MNLRPLGELWILTSISPPPTGTWFFGRYQGRQVMPTYIFAEGACISVRVDQRDVKIIHHTIALPSEWRP